MTFTPGSYVIAIANPKQVRGRGGWKNGPPIPTTVVGWVSGDGIFGIQYFAGSQKADPNDVPDHFYRLTHIPSGRSFGGLYFAERTDAQLAAERFAALPAAWGSTDPKMITSTPGSRELYDAMKRNPAHRGSWKGIPLGRDYANPHASI